MVTESIGALIGELSKREHVANVGEGVDTG